MAALNKEVMQLGQSLYNQPRVLGGARGPMKEKVEAKLGSFCLDGIPSTTRGVPQIEVKFDIDANGILSVTTIDKGMGKKQNITITGASTLPSDEVARMVNEAEKFSKENKEKRDAIDTKNQADSLGKKYYIPFT